MADDVVLILPRFRYPGGDFSLGLAALGAYLRRHLPGLRISLIDATFHPDPAWVRRRLLDARPAVAAIYADTLMFEDAVAVAGLCAEAGASVIMGGPHPTIRPEEAIAPDAVDAICIGEGEEPLLGYVRSRAGGGRIDDVPGLWFKRDGAVVRSPGRPAPADLDALPPPAVDLYDVERYVRTFIQLDSYRPGLRGMSLVASRGCPYRCRYCQPTLTRIFGPRARIRSPRLVVDDLAALRERYALDAFYFQDDTLTAFGDWVREFCAELTARVPGVVWACNTRADTGDAALLAVMARAGCVKLKVGVESVTDRVRNGIYRKNVSMAQVEGLIAAAGAAGIQVAGFFMLGAPTETAGEIRETIRWAVASDLVEANFSVATALPGTGLWDLARERGWELPATPSGFDYYKARRPSHAAGDPSPRAVERLRREAVLRFYLHPKRAGRVAASLASRAGAVRMLAKLRRF